MWEEYFCRLEFHYSGGVRDDGGKASGKDDGGIAEDSGREFPFTQNHCLQIIDFYTDFTNTQIHAHTPYYIEHILIPLYST